MNGIILNLINNNKIEIKPENNTKESSIDFEKVLNQKNSMQNEKTYQINEQKNTKKETSSEEIKPLKINDIPVKKEIIDNDKSQILEKIKKIINLDGMKELSKEQKNELIKKLKNLINNLSNEDNTEQLKELLLQIQDILKKVNIKLEVLNIKESKEGKNNIFIKIKNIKTDEEILIPQKKANKYIHVKIIPKEIIEKNDTKTKYNILQKNVKNIKKSDSLLEKIQDKKSEIKSKQVFIPIEGEVKETSKSLEDLNIETSENKILEMIKNLQINADRDIKQKDEKIELGKNLLNNLKLNVQASNSNINNKQINGILEMMQKDNLRTTENIKIENQDLIKKDFKNIQNENVIFKPINNLENKSEKNEQKNSEDLKQNTKKNKINFDNKKTENDSNSKQYVQSSNKIENTSNIKQNQLNTTNNKQNVTMLPLKELNNHIEQIIQKNTTLNTFTETINIKITPPDLGEITVELIKTNKTIIINIITDNESSKSQIARTLQQLITQLKDNGYNPVQVKVEVDVENDYLNNQKENPQKNNENEKNKENKENESQFEDLLRGEEI
ncbi:flagellar hook-length control protein FliK [Oceanotoga teriensis]|uniref:flagellar hook-length control protein FliK n=1 Tax=Oceanotoga teriensis TaxID=515440 RepID=UPI002713AEB7|nr:flagellar hook-length control protein FliK [Oceanotoga teriensis]MDO7975431.1 flagellar hook-length control protein FliK [Oceanotoga teriensis]